MANYPQELAQDAVCQSHSDHMNVLWFLPTRPLLYLVAYMNGSHAVTHFDTLSAELSHS